MNGLWTVEFGSSAGIFGGGVAVFSDGRVLGGDSGYYYTGSYQVQQDGSFSAELVVTPFIPGIQSVFRTVGHPLKLHLIGTFTDANHAIAQGQAPDIPNIRFGAKLAKRA